MNYKRPAVITVTASLLILSGCASVEMTEVDQLKAKLVEQEQMSEQLQSKLSSVQGELSERTGMFDKKVMTYEQELEMARKNGGSLLPPGAKPGECYARVFIPPTYETSTRQILATEASEKIAVSPARYGWGEERVLVKEASTQLKVIPARYDWAEEQVLVKEASEKLIVTPAVYRDESEKMLVSPAYTTWKKGRGPIERIDQATGEIMCLVEVPATYKTVVKKVLAQAATTRRMTIPAEYKTVKKRVMVEGPRTVEVEIPAEYETVRVSKLIEPANENRVTIPERYQEVTETKLVNESSLEWRPILCETNTTPRVVSRLQQALDQAGYAPGPIDGVVGAQTMSAVTRYQRAKGLASGKLTIETLRQLRVL